MTVNLNSPASTLTHKRDLIEHTLATRDLHPTMAAAMGIGADRITAELERHQAALLVQAHDMDPLDESFAQLAPGRPE